MERIRLIWDDCTPIAERRPITKEDIEEDIHIKEFGSEEELLQHLLNLLQYDDEDVEFPEGATMKDKIETILQYFEDPGDGYPNILYASIDGAVLDNVYPYDSLKDLDLEHCSEKEIVDILKKGAEETEDWLKELADRWGVDLSYEYPKEDDLDEELTEASTAFKKAFKNGGDDLDDLIQGKAIARIKDPKSREAAVAAIKADREDVVKQFTGDRKEDQAERAYEKKAEKAAEAGLEESLDEALEDDKMLDLLLKDLNSLDEPIIEEGCKEDLETPEWEKKKEKALEYYNSVKEWAGEQAKNRTCANCNIDLEQLNEWLGENNND